MPRILQSVVIVAFFGVMMALLMRDHVVPSLTRAPGIEVDRRVLTDGWVNLDEWMRVSLAGQQVGVLRTTAEREDDDTFSATAHLDLNYGIIKGRVMSAVRMNRRLIVESARVRAAIPPLGRIPPSPETLDAEELPEGAIELIALIRGNNMNIRIRRDDAVKFLTENIARPLTMADSITPILRGQMMTQNVIYSTDLYDPLMGSSGKTEIEWIGVERYLIPGREMADVVKRVEIRYSGMRTTLLVDQVGNIVRREIPLIAPTGLGGGGNTSASSDSAPVLVFERVDDPRFRDAHQSLESVPALPNLTAADFSGEDQGRVFPSVGILSLFGQPLANQATGRNP